MQEAIPMRKKDPEMHKRLCEEVYRLGDSTSEVAKKLNCHPNTLGQWLNHDYIPSAYFFKNFHEAGADILYILTGERRA
jgi:hypothetical protein